MQKFKEARDSEYKFKINWKKLAFNNIASNKVSRDKVFNIAKILNIMNINVDLLQWFTNCFDKKK